jgi:adenylate cyclase
VSETRKIAAILVADVVGYSRLTGADEDRALARLRAVRSDLIDPLHVVHHGRVVKRTGDGAIVEFRSVVDAVRCAIEVQQGMFERNAGVPPEKRIEFRIGIHLGDVVEESDGDLMGDGVNIAARLEGVAQPGAICLSEQAYWQVKGRLDLKVSDLGNTQLKNIVEPIHVYSLEVGQPALAKPTSSAAPADQAKAAASKRRMGSALLPAAIAALLLLAIAGGWYILNGRTPRPAEAAHLSVVVLPFTNLSGDPSQDYFADGITENLTTALSRVHDSFVIARNTAFTYKGKSIDAKEIGKELGVRYVLEGSVQRDQNRVRVNAQLVDAASGAHLWADQFDEDVADLFKLQDEVVTRLARSLNLALVKAEAEKAGRSNNPDAVDLTMRGFGLEAVQCPKGGLHRDCIHEAQALFERALQIDPNNADALAGSAGTYLDDRLFGWGEPGTDYEANIMGRANRAINLAPDDAYVYFPKAQYLSLSGRHSEALAVANAGLAADPNFVLLYLPRSVAENSLGRYEQAKADAERAIRLSPRDPEVGTFHVIVGDAEINLGHLDAAIDAYRKAIDSGLHQFYVYTNIAAAYAHAGKTDEAKAALAEARRLNPAITVKWMKEHTPNLPAVFDGLRKAGLPEE